jgi:hypothetical protein
LKREKLILRNCVSTIVQRRLGSDFKTIFKCPCVYVKTTAGVIQRTSLYTYTKIKMVSPNVVKEKARGRRHAMSHRSELMTLITVLYGCLLFFVV